MGKFSSGSYCLIRDFCRLCILACKKKRTRIFRSWKWKKSQRWVMSSGKNSTVKEMCPKLFLKHNDEQKLLCVLLCSMGVSASSHHFFSLFWEMMHVKDFPKGSKYVIWLKLLQKNVFKQKERHLWKVSYAQNLRKKKEMTNLARGSKPVSCTVKRLRPCRKAELSW